MMLCYRRAIAETVNNVLPLFLGNIEVLLVLCVAGACMHVAGS